MAERTEREILHHLVEICYDAERGFRAAANYVHDPSLKKLFAQLAEQRRRFADDLIPHLHRLGGRIDPYGTSAGALHRRWMGVKAFVPGHGDHAIVAEAERGELVAFDAYQEALSGMLPPGVSSLVEAQRDAVQAAREQIRTVEYAA